MSELILGFYWISLQVKGQDCVCKRRTDACQHANRSVGQRPRQRRSRSLTARCYTKQALVTPSNTSLCLSCEEPVSVNTPGGSHDTEKTPQSSEMHSDVDIPNNLIILGLFY